MLTSLSLTAFFDQLASRRPTPGGGSASAIAGAMAGALVQMVASLSGEGQEETLAQGQVLINQLAHLANCDADAFNEVMAAFQLPKTTEQEKQRRSQAIQKATETAVEVPLKVMDLSLRALRLAKEIAVHGNPNALSDAGVAGLLSTAAVKGASYNVLINLPGLKDSEYVAAAKRRVAEMLAITKQLETELADYVLQAWQ